MLNQNLTLLIHSCDKFSDLWDVHIKLLNQSWGDRNIRTIVLTDKPTDHKLPGVEIIASGEGDEITARIRYVLPLIETEYVLVTLDDYFPIIPISNKRIERLVDIMERESYDYMRLFDRPHCPLQSTVYENIFTYTLDKDYRVNLYAGIWKKTFIAQTLPEIGNMNAWEFEVSLTKVANKIGAKCAVSRGKEFEILDVVRKGKILRNANKYLKKYDLYHGARPVMKWQDEFKLWIKTEGNRFLHKYFPKNLYYTVKRLCMKFGMNSFSGQQDK